MLTLLLKKIICSKYFEMPDKHLEERQRAPHTFSLSLSFSLRVGNGNIVKDTGHQLRGIAPVEIVELEMETRAERSILRRVLRLEWRR